MDNDAAAREMLFGVTALQMGLVERKGLTTALAAWAATRDRTLARVLTDGGHLDRDGVAAVERRVESALATHGRDVGLALEAAGPVGEELRRLLGPPTATVGPT